jgi:hypothetical protein
MSNTTGEGEGIVGRTITCRYCNGQKKLACPICAVDDPYAWSYGGDGNKLLKNSHDETIEDQND